MKIVFKIITLSLLFTFITSASKKVQIDIKPYSLMSTQELQIEVEKLSELGELPFEMGLELLKRWKNT